MEGCFGRVMGGNPIKPIISQYGINPKGRSQTGL